LSDRPIVHAQPMQVGFESTTECVPTMPLRENGIAHIFVLYLLAVLGLGLTTHLADIQGRENHFRTLVHLGASPMSELLFRSIRRLPQS